jgi:uncharacterized protein involved in outer membrane biogenesis
MRKLLLGVLSLLVLLAAVVVFLLVHDFDSPDLGKALLDKVSAATGVTITARTFELNLLHGLTLGGVEVKTDSGGRTAHIVLDSLVFQHRLGPLFSGTIAIDKVLLDHPVIELVEASAPAAAPGEPAPPPPSPAPAPAPAPAAAPAAPPAATGGEPRKLSLELKELTIQDAKVSIVQKDKQPGSRILLDGLTVSLRDVGFNPSAASLAAISGTGDITLTKATLNAMVVSDVRSAFQLANAAFTMRELAMTLEFGKLTSSMTLDLKPEPFEYALKATGSAIDVNKLIGATGGLGPASLQLDAKGQGPEPEAVKASGSVKLTAGKIPTSKLSEAIDKVLGKPILAGSPYKPADLSFTLDKGVLTLSPFRFETEKARVDLKGTAALAGPLDLDLDLATPREGIAIEGLGGATLDVLSDAQGWVPIPISVSGTLDEPKVRPDTSALLAQAKTGAKREAKEAAHTAAQNAKEKAGTALRKKIKK